MNTALTFNENKLLYKTPNSNKISSIYTFEYPITSLIHNPNNNTALINIKSPIPALADDCLLYDLNTNNIKKLPNIQQNLCTDTAIANQLFITFNGGMQNDEIRFIDPKGSWKIKFPHEAQILLITQADIDADNPYQCALSLDATGLALVWENESIIDDFYLPLSFELVDLIKFTPPVATSKHKKKQLHIITPNKKLYLLSPNNNPLLLNNDLDNTEKIIKIRKIDPMHTHPYEPKF